MPELHPPASRIFGGERGLNLPEQHQLFPRPFPRGREDGQSTGSCEMRIGKRAPGLAGCEDTRAFFCSFSFAFSFCSFLFHIMACEGRELSTAQNGSKHLSPVHASLWSVFFNAEMKHGVFLLCPCCPPSWELPYPHPIHTRSFQGHGRRKGVLC